MAVKKSVLDFIGNGYYNDIVIDEGYHPSFDIHYTYGGSTTQIVYHEFTMIMSVYDSNGDLRILGTTTNRWTGNLVTGLRISDEKLAEIYSALNTYAPTATDININYILESFTDSNYQNSLGTSSLEGYGYFSQLGSSPTFTNFSYEDINSTTLALTGNNQKIIKGYSNVRYTIDNNNKAVARSGGNIVSYEFKKNNGSEVVSTISYPITKTYNAYNESDLQVKVTDSRGFNTKVTKSDNIIDYYLPSGTLTAQREGATTKGKLDFSGTYWNGNFGTGNNTIVSAFFRVKPKNGSWGSWFQISNQDISVNNGSVYIETTTTAYGVPLTVGTEYEVEFKITDGISSNKTFNTIDGMKANISNGQVLDSYYKDNNGNYKYAINKIVDVNGETLQINGNVSNSLASGDSYFRAKRTDTNVAIDLIVGTGGTNHGLYSRKLDKWMIYGDNDDVWYKKVAYENTNGQTIHLMCTDASGGTHGKLYTTSGLNIWHKQGTTSATGRSELVLGNNIGSGTNGNKDGTIRLFTTGTGSNYIARANNGHGNTRWNYLPDKDGTFAMVEDIFYSSGDTIEFGNDGGIDYFTANGYISSSTQGFYCTITTPKRLDNISTITVNTLILEIRGNNGYINGSGYKTYTNGSTYEVTATKVAGINNQIRVMIKKKSGTWSATNNTPAEANGKFKFTLS